MIKQYMIALGFLLSTIIACIWTFPMLLQWLIKSPFQEPLVNGLVDIIDVAPEAVLGLLSVVAMFYCFIKIASGQRLAPFMSYVSIGAVLLSAVLPMLLGTLMALFLIL